MRRVPFLDTVGVCAGPWRGMVAGLGRFGSEKLISVAMMAQAVLEFVHCLSESG